MAEPRPQPLGGVIRLAAASRLLVLTLSLLCRLLFRPYDTSASLRPPCLASSGDLPRYPAAAAAAAAAAAVESSVVWDGVHFTRIAECGYEYEQSFAFLPLLPFVMALLSRSVFAPLVPVLGYRAVLVISGYLVNNIAFVLAAVYFYRLSVLILRDPGAAFRATVLFCFNPASIFYSSLYSESLYALLSLGGLFYLFSGANTVAMILLALSGSARSNGALNAGYFCFQALLVSYDAIVQKRRPILAAQALIAGVLRSIFLFLPFLAFQGYGYLNICLKGNSEELRPWCKAKIPLLYSSVQSHYWGVGFLRYFQVKQLPNFLLASPVLSLAVYSIVHCATMLRQLLRSTSIDDEIISAAKGKSLRAYESSDVTSVLRSELSGIHRGNTKAMQRKSVATETVSASLPDTMSSGKILPVDQGETSIVVLPFILHLAFLTFTAFFFMHVQVATRFLSASPPVYWAASHILVSPRNSSKKWGYLICAYFIAYILLGSLLFSNFYPFT